MCSTLLRALRACALLVKLFAAQTGGFARLDVASFTPEFTNTLSLGFVKSLAPSLDGSVLYYGSDTFFRQLDPATLAENVAARMSGGGYFGASTIVVR